MTYRRIPFLSLLRLAVLAAWAACHGSFAQLSPPTTGAVSAGGTHTLAIKSNGTLWAWGGNGSGQLGVGSFAPQYTPTQVTALSSVVDASASVAHSAAVKPDGTVWTWGTNTYGQLGIGSLVSKNLPTQVTGLSNAVRVATGDSSTFAVKADGTLWAWGLNTSGQLGNGTLVSSSTPVQVSGLSGVFYVAASKTHTVAVKSDGTVWAWGANAYGQLGDGTTTTRSTPVQVGALTGVSSVAAGQYHTLALKSDGTVWAWGQNQLGQLGDGSLSNRLSPVQIASLTGVVSVGASASRSAALKSDGSAWAWGSNSNGELGDGTVTSRSSPVAVQGVSAALRVSLAGGHGVILRSDGSVYCWGNPGSGRLGDGSSQFRDAPVQVNGLDGIVNVSAGYSHTLALRNDGTVWAWGTNLSGELGNGTTTPSAVPTKITSLSGIVAVAAGDSFSLAAKSDGTVWAWGDNSSGALGDNSTTNRLSPVQVSGLSGVTGVAAGFDHSIARKSDGTAWAWGSNAYGQIGDGTTDDRLVPTKASGLTGATQVAAGYGYSVALKSDGTVRAWGFNGFGQLGNNTTDDKLVPTTVAGLSGITAVSAGDSCATAIKSPGTVWNWGFVSAYVGAQVTPAQVTGLTEVSEVASGYDLMVAVKTNGSSFEWGGLQEFATYKTAMRGVMKVAAGLSSTVAVRSDGRVYAWGSNAHGQLGVLATLTRAAIRLTAASGDNDQDGMADSWESSHFSSLSHAGGDDTDRDGLTDIQEYVANSDPKTAFFDAYVPRAGLRLWLKADSLNLWEGDPVASWPDSSGNNSNSTQATEANQPTYSEAGINGKPCVHFSSAANQYLAIPDKPTLRLQQPTIAAVVRRNSGSETALLAEKGDGNIGYSLRMIDVSTGGSKINGNEASTGPVITTATPCDLLSTYDESEHKLYLNGELRDTNAYTAELIPSSGPLTIGGRSATYNLNGDIAELLIYDHPLSEADRLDLGTYLAMKYPVSVMTKLPPPQSSVRTGTYAAPQSVTLSLPDANGAAIFYTLDGSVPTAGSTPYTGAIAVSTSLTLRAIALKEGYLPSDSASWKIKIDPESGVVSRSGLKLWLRADTLSGTPVSSWEDQSGSENHASQTNAPDQPTLVPTGLNGKPTVHFTASQTQYLTVPNSAGLNPEQVSVVALLKRDSGTGTMIPLEKGVDDSYSLRLKDVNATAGTYAASSYLSTAGIIGPASIPFGQYTVVIASYDRATHQVLANGAVQASAAYTSAVSASTSSMTIGGRGTSYSLDGDIAELMVYDHGLSDSELAGLHEYFHVKYGVGPKPTLPPPVFGLASGIYSGPTSLTISGYAGSTIRYTLDGSIPTATSPAYTVPLTVSATTTIRAISLRPSFNDSAVSSICMVFDEDAGAFEDGLATSYNLDSNGNGIPDSVESALGLNPQTVGNVVPGAASTYSYDKLHRVKSAPGGTYDQDEEGNIRGQ